MERKALADRYNLALGFNHGMGLTGAVNLFGPTDLCLTLCDKPDVVDAYLELEHQNNLANYAIALDMGVDFIRRNGFYESVDLFSPDILTRMLSRRLKEEIAMAHQHGKLFAYAMLTGMMPILDYLAGLDFDCLLHPDIFYKGMDGVAIKARLGMRKSFWTGPSDTIHMPWDKPEEVRKAVRQVFEVFGKTGLIITPCSSAKAVFPWENVLAMVDEWKRLR